MPDTLSTRIGKPSPRGTRHPGSLSLVIPPRVGAMSTNTSWGVNRHTTWCASPFTWSRSVGWCLAEDKLNRDQRRSTRSGSTLEAVCDDMLHKSFTLLDA